MIFKMQLEEAAGDHPVLSLPEGRINYNYVSLDRCSPNWFLKVSNDDEFTISPDVLLQCLIISMV